MFCDILCAMGPYFSLKWWKIQLDVHYEVRSLITINSYIFIAAYKPAALSLLEVLHFEYFNYIIISQYFSIFVLQWWVFPKPVTNTVIILLFSLAILTLCVYSNHNIIIMLSLLLIRLGDVQ